MHVMAYTIQLKAKEKRKQLAILVSLKEFNSLRKFEAIFEEL